MRWNWLPSMWRKRCKDRARKRGYIAARQWLRANPGKRFWAYDHSLWYYEFDPLWYYEFDRGLGRRNLGFNQTKWRQRI